jgi:hypothetical protein
MQTTNIGDAMNSQIDDSVIIAVDFFLNSFFENGVLSESLKTKYPRINTFLFKHKLCLNDRGVAKIPTKEMVFASITEKTKTNPHFASLFIKTMKPGGLDTIFPRMMENKQSKGIIFDPIQNRTGDNTGTKCRIKLDDMVVIEFIAGNGSMYNIIEQGHAFFLNTMMGDGVKYFVTHKMDGRYVGLYIAKIQIGDEIVTLMTIHSRKGPVLCDAVFLDGSAEIAKKMTIEWDLERQKREQDINGKFKYTTEITTKFAKVLLPEAIQPFVVDFVRGGQIVHVLLVSQEELKTAISIGLKIAKIIQPNQIILVNCEGTKDNMRPLYDKYIVENYTKFPGLFPHPIGTVVYQLAKSTKENEQMFAPIDPSKPIRYISDPTFFDNLEIPYCQIFSSPSGNKTWTISELLDGANKIPITFQIGKDLENAEIFRLVNYANAYKLNELMINGKFTEFVFPIYPGHIVEGVIISAVIPDGSVYSIKVKDPNFADEDEMKMALPQL